MEQENCPPGGCEEPFKVYPNPVSDELTVSITNENSVVTLADSNGSIVYRVNPAKHNKEIIIPVKKYKNGTYYLSITQNGTITQRQIIINH